MDFLWRFSVRAPRTALTLCFVCVVILSPGILRLRLATDGLALVPENSAAAEVDRAAREHFGIHDQVIVVLRSEHRDGVLNLESLERLARLTEALAQSGLLVNDELALLTRLCLAPISSLCDRQMARSCSNS